MRYIIIIEIILAILFASMNVAATTLDTTSCGEIGGVWTIEIGKNACRLQGVHTINNDLEINSNTYLWIGTPSDAVGTPEVDKIINNAHITINNGGILANKGSFTNNGIITIQQGGLLWIFGGNNIPFINNCGGSIENNGYISGENQISTGNDNCVDGHRAPGSDNGIPEFPTVALPVVGVIGLMFLFQRRKAN